MRGVRLFNLRPTGEMQAEECIRGDMGHGGVEDCANAQNCVKAWPKEIPLTESIAEVTGGPGNSLCLAG